MSLSAIHTEYRTIYFIAMQSVIALFFCREYLLKGKFSTVDMTLCSILICRMSLVRMSLSRMTFGRMTFSRMTLRRLKKKKTKETRGILYCLLCSVSHFIYKWNFSAECHQAKCHGASLISCRVIILDRTFLPVTNTLAY